jgi:hypothetical protein
VARQALDSSLVGARATVWCPGGSTPRPPVWVCGVDLGTSIEVDVGGAAPSPVPLGPGGGLPLRAAVSLEKETFS